MQRMFLRIGVTTVIVLMTATIYLSRQKSTIFQTAEAKQVTATLPSGPFPVTTGLPTADELLQRYEAFLGGAKALAKANTRTIWAHRFTSGGAPSESILLRLSKKPGLSIMQHRNLDGTFSHWQNGCDGKTGWSWSHKDTGEILQSNASGVPICDQELYYYGYLPLDLARMKQDYKRLEVKAMLKIVQPSVGEGAALAGGIGPDLVGSGPRDAYLVLGIPARQGDNGVWLLFDKETGALLRRQRENGPTLKPPAENDIFTSFLQYRKVGDGTVAPFQFVTQNKNAVVRGIEMKIEDNAPIANDAFTMPKTAMREDKGRN